MITSLSNKTCKKCGNLFKGVKSSSICFNCNLKKCKTCATEFINHHSAYCSVKCRDLNKTTLKGSIKTGDYLKCQSCNKSYYAAKWQQNSGKKYCSRKCADSNKSKQFEVYLQCANEFCKKSLKRSKYDYLRTKSKTFYCCVKCLNIARSQKASQTRKFTGTKPELLFAEKLKNNNIDYCIQYWVNWKKGWKKFYDFYLPNIDTLIEVDGTYWHGKGLSDEQLNEQQIKTRSNDKIKDELAKNNNYKLVRIWEDEIESFDVKIFI